MEKNTADLKKYQKKTDKQHILDNPDTYIGSVELVESQEFVFDMSSESIISKTIEFIPGLYKLFDEAIVNCRDHVIRMQQAIDSDVESAQLVNKIEVSIDDDGTISMLNNGNGIDIAQHPEYKLWIPEMIFAHLRTSTNYDKSEKKIVGGKNGFGVKLIFIWSTWGKIETVDHTRGKKYIQEFKNNLDIIEKPLITKCKSKPYTKISFKPDFKRLGISGLSDDMINLLRRRIYDIAAVTNSTVSVKYNGNVIPVKNFQQYVKKITGDGDIKYEEANKRWEYVVGLSNKDEFYQVSFVNGIYTSKGGKHVEYILNQITKKLCLYIKTKKKLDVKASSIKEQLALFIRCDIENPAFDSQTKDFMNTPISKFGSTCVVSDKFIEKIAKMGVMNTACALTEVKENKSQKKTDGTKNKNIRGIPKLLDANYAGTSKSSKCMIILCEGDSAKAGIVSGLCKDDRNYIGVYPMKGKMFNVRGENIAKIGDNKEICEIKQILGLEHGMVYTQELINTKLRYGKVVFMTDQDLDGSHIKGLGINLFESEWKSLIEVPGFMAYMNTPILKATKGKEIKEFYNIGEFDKWKDDEQIDIKKWYVKYYKGLGTSTSNEFKQYFAKKKLVSFTSNGDDSSNAIDMVFNKNRSDDRKKWLSTYDRDLYLNTSNENISYEEFINKDLIHFSKYDNDRSIPNIIDGLKISHRKILFSAFKKNLKNEIKVAQFSGYVSEHSCYHHGEASLSGAIVGLAQDYVGSNNVNLLEPKGQFGCLDPNTQILMWNGQMKIAEHIQIGDKLVGDDGSPRIVSKLIEGNDNMYMIKNNNAASDNYIVNSNHILTLCFPNHKKVYWTDNNKSWNINYYDAKEKMVKHIIQKTDKSTKLTHSYSIGKDQALDKITTLSESLCVPDTNVFDINLQDYLALAPKMKKQFFGIYNSTPFHWVSQETPFDPYDYANTILDSREISSEYMINSVENRHKLLAGILDRYGDAVNSFEYKLISVEKEKAHMYSKIFGQIKTIGISLGYKSIISSVANEFKLTIYSNNLNNIPSKKFADKFPNDDGLEINRMIHKINVEAHDSNGRFCGWHIDSNERFLLADGTITHNTRLRGGKDASSERYIFTHLSKLTRYIYRPEDDKVLTYLNDDGTPVEPIYYVPIVPMILFNGTKGIGTGFSTEIICYNPIQIMNKLIRMLKANGLDKTGMKIDPYYHGFDGTIQYFQKANRYLIKGKYKRPTNDKIQITELPIGTWTDDYKQFLEGLMSGDTKKKTSSKCKNYIKEYTDLSTEAKVDITVTFYSGLLDELLSETVDCSNNTIHECNALEKYLKLYTLHSANNMHLFDGKEKLKRYESVEEIIDEFYKVRLEYYNIRREYLIGNLNKELIILSNKARFIKDNLDGTIDMRGMKNDDIIKMLGRNKYDMRNEDNYEYLIGLPMKSVSHENVERLMKEKTTKDEELCQIKATKKEEMWINELEILKEKYVEFIK